MTEVKEVARPLAIAVITAVPIHVTPGAALLLVLGLRAPVLHHPVAVCLITAIAEVKVIIQALAAVDHFLGEVIVALHLVTTIAEMKAIIETLVAVGRGDLIPHFRGIGLCLGDLIGHFLGIGLCLGEHHVCEY